MKPTHTTHNISDYVLGLLSPQEAQAVAQHLNGCETCRAQAAAEAQIGAQVRTVLQTAVPVNNRRLQQLMPPVPTKRRVVWGAAWQRQLASVAMLLILLLGGMGLYQSNRQPGVGGAPTMLAITATNTQSATATAQETLPAATQTAQAHIPVEEPAAMEAAVYTISLSPPAPAPSATPIAAVPMSSN